MIVRKSICVLLAYACLLAFASPRAQADEVVINIVGNGTNAQYVKQGQTTQLNVVVYVGDTVKWVNMGDRTHTATSDVLVAGTPLFDTHDITTTTPVTISFDAALYAKASAAVGASAGGRVHLGYFCAKHPDSMGGKIVFKPATERGKPAASDH